MDMEASVLTLSLLALRMVPSIVDTAVQINNAFVVSLSVCQIVSSKYQIRNVFQVSTVNLSYPQELCCLPPDPPNTPTTTVKPETTQTTSKPDMDGREKNIDNLSYH